MWNTGQGECLTQCHGPLVEECTSGNLGNNLVEDDALEHEMIQTLKMCGNNNAYKDDRVGRLLLNFMETRQRDNEKARVVKKQLKAKREAHTQKVLISCSGRADIAHSKYKCE